MINHADAMNFSRDFDGNDNEEFLDMQTIVSAKDFREADKRQKKNK